VEAVYRHSQGIPRIANLLCEHALINAFVDQVRPVPAAIVEGVAHEFELQKADLVAKQGASGGNGDNSELVMEAVIRNLQLLLEEMARKNAAKREPHDSDVTPNS